MCGRFTQKSERPDIQLEFYIQGWNVSPKASYNIAPSQKAGIIFRDDERNIYDEFQWGLIPNWSKDLKTAYSMINAKAETINQKPSFKNSFIKKRCLVPATGFFEWKKVGNGKIPYYIFLDGGQLFSFAGIFDEWFSKNESSERKDSIKTFSIITTEANELVAEIHDKKRMPVIIEKKDRELWLNNNEYPEKDLLDLLRPYDTDLMRAYEVSKYVNSPNNNSSKCIEPV
jgi:putative SOS response-associated peptidase YedK